MPDYWLRAYKISLGRIAAHRLVTKSKGWGGSGIVTQVELPKDGPTPSEIYPTNSSWIHFFPIFFQLFSIISN
jgi:hypothetical protein